mgnify:CR=1 FL=1
MKEYILPILIFLGFGALSGILLLIASKVLACLLYTSDAADE